MTSRRSKPHTSEVENVVSDQKGSLTWGRTGVASVFLNIQCISIVFFSPMLVLLLHVAIFQFGGSISDTVRVFFIDMSRNFLHEYLSSPWKFLSWTVVKYFVVWVLFQAFLYMFVPGRIANGAPTPAGHILKYRVNGFQCWLVTMITAITAVKLGWIDATIIADNWSGLLICANLYGFALTLFCYFKALLFPSHPEDRKFSGYTLYDIHMGVELNPRIGEMFDFKLFHNGRPGIVGWSFINLSFAFAQPELSNSMILVNILQAIYSIDYLCNEEWYLKTIDIAHDHFGFYLAWGDSVWLPFMYTLQAQWLSKNPVHLTTLEMFLILALGVSGYIIFRVSNNQKDEFRKKNGNVELFGKPAKYIEAEYQTSDGKIHKSKLLVSGFWGLSRHFNYLGDLMLSLSYCLPCGFSSPIPYFYIAFMVVLLVHRCFRDETRCYGKYGKDWIRYCNTVPYRIIPYIF
jgi:7-dehydrocholesterol reductase